LKRNNNNNNSNKYIPVRILQLREDCAKAHNDLDKAWYNRLIQELDWADQMLNSSKPSRNCSL